MKKIRIIAVLLAISLCCIQFASSAYKNGNSRLSDQCCLGKAEWYPNVYYAVGQEVKFHDHLYKVLQIHFSNVIWEPSTTPSLYQDLGACNFDACFEDDPK